MPYGPAITSGSTYSIEPESVLTKLGPLAGRIVSNVVSHKA